MQVWGCMKRVALHQGLQDSSPGVGDCVFFDLARALVYRDAMPIYANLCHIWSIMKHHESLRIIMNLQSLLAVTIMNHCLERSDKSDMFGQATGTTCLCRGWSFISMTLLKKTIAVCSNPKDSPWSPTSPIHATSHAVSGLKCLVSKDTNSWSTQGVSVASSSQIAQVTGESGSTGSTAGKYSLYLVVLNWAKPRCSWTKMSELGGKQKEENEQTDKSSLIYLVMLRYYS
jgi:hypothetical protein